MKCWQLASKVASKVAPAMDAELETERSDRTLFYLSCLPWCSSSCNSKLWFRIWVKRTAIAIFSVVFCVDENLIGLLPLDFLGLPRKNPPGSPWGSTVEHAIFKNWQQNSQGKGTALVTPQQKGGVWVRSFLGRQYSQKNLSLAKPTKN